MAAAHYKQQDHIRRVSARSFLTNISLDGSHRDTCYGQLVASRRHNDVDAVTQDNRAVNQLTQTICPVSGGGQLELSDMIGLDVPAADINTADASAESKLHISSESTFIRCMSADFNAKIYSSFALLVFVFSHK